MVGIEGRGFVELVGGREMESSSSWMADDIVTGVCSLDRIDGGYAATS